MFPGHPVHVMYVRTCEGLSYRNKLWALGSYDCVRSDITNIKERDNGQGESKRTKETARGGTRTEKYKRRLRQNVIAVIGDVIANTPSITRSITGAGEKTARSRFIETEKRPAILITMRCDRAVIRKGMLHVSWVFGNTARYYLISRVYIAKINRRCDKRCRAHLRYK